MISFSTCWNSHRHTCGREMVYEIREMGFDTVEVSHGLKITLLPGILRAFQAGEVRISGIHNFCPSPVEVMIDAPDAYEFTSHREYERNRAVELTLRSLETAAQFRSKYLVMHMGTVPMKKTTTKLETMVQAGKLHPRQSRHPLHATSGRRPRKNHPSCHRTRDQVSHRIQKPFRAGSQRT
jgi:sugar phosphate isomerase/epimerase